MAGVNQLRRCVNGNLKSRDVEDDERRRCFVMMCWPLSSSSFLEILKASHLLSKLLHPIPKLPEIEKLTSLAKVLAYFVRKSFSKTLSLQNSPRWNRSRENSFSSFSLLFPSSSPRKALPALKVLTKKLVYHPSQAKPPSKSEIVVSKRILKMVFFRFAPTSFGDRAGWFGLCGATKLVRTTNLESRFFVSPDCSVAVL